MFIKIKAIKESQLEEAKRKEKEEYQTVHISDSQVFFLFKNK